MYNSIISRKKKTKAERSKLFTVIVALTIWGHAYVVPFFPQVNFGEVALLLGVVYLLFTGRPIRINVKPRLALFFFYGVFVSVAVSFFIGSYKEMLFRVLRDAFYWAILILFVFHFLDFTLFKKIVKLFCVVLSCVLISQMIVYKLTGVYLPAYPFAGMVDANTTGRDIYDHIIFWIGHSGYLKSYGLLSEAAHCAQALFIGSLFCMSEDCPIKKWLPVIVLYLVASILTFAASAVVYVAFTVVLVLFKIAKSRGFKLNLKNTIIIAGLMAVMLFVGIVVILNSQSQGVFSRVIASFSSSTADSSSFTRIYKGFAYWLKLPFIYKIVGIGFGNYSEINGYYSFASAIDIENEFMNSLSYILVSSGIIGFIILISYFVWLYKRADSNGRIMILALALMSMAVSLYNSPYWIWFMIGIYYNSKYSAKSIKEI